MPERSEAFAFITEFQPREGWSKKFGITAIQRAFRDLSVHPSTQTSSFAHLRSFQGSPALAGFHKKLHQSSMNGLQFPAKQHEVQGVAKRAEMSERSEAFAFITEFQPCEGLVKEIRG